MAQGTAVKKKEPNVKKYSNFLGTTSWTKQELDKYVEKVIDQMGKGDSDSKITIKELITLIVEQSGALYDRYNISKAQMEGIYNVGYQAFNQGNYKQAVGMFRLLFILNPLETKYVFSLGLSLEKSKQYFEAATAYMMNYHLDETNPIPYFRTGVCFLELGESIVAADMFYKTIECCGTAPEYKTIAERTKLFLSGIEAPRKKA